MPAIDPSSLAGALGTDNLGSQFSIGASEEPAGAGGIGALEGTPDSGSSFSSVLGKQLDSLSSMQAEAADASVALATGTATDPEAVVMAVERARLSMQLAAQLRTKGVEAINEIFRTQV